jgi:hypothetical protein
MFSLKSKLASCVVSLLIIVLINGCNPAPNSTSPGTFPVDSIFSDFYREFGDVTILGPAISPTFIKDGITYQYVVAGLMAYDPKQLPLKRFHFSSIASVEWKINGPVEPNPSDPNLRYINGHRIWEEILSFYTQYGPDIIGLPLTGVATNDAKQRYEQYFDGIGFYRKYSEPPGQIHLMPYGYWMCGSNCQYHESDSVLPTASYSRDYSETEQLFLQASERLGYGFTGAPLTAPQLASDGYYEMVFENVIMYLEPSNGNLIRLRPLPAWLGIQADQLRTATNTDWLSFFQIQNELGYNVPNSFLEYIANHGSLTYSGNPITEYHILTDGGYSQCFTNICLEFHPTAPEQLRIRPHALGIEYHTTGANTITSEPSIVDALQINAWEEYPLIPSGQRQTINIEATQNDAPVRGMEFSLIVKQPDGITKTYQSNPTGDDGRTSIGLDPIDGPNGAIIQYKVCVIGAVTPQVCFSRSYTIWEP